MTGAELIAAERQIEEEGFDSERDAKYEQEELLAAAVAYLLSDVAEAVDFYWPLDESWWKPTGGVEDLVKAGALIAAKIDRRHVAAASRLFSNPEIKSIRLTGTATGQTLDG